MIVWNPGSGSYSTDAQSYSFQDIYCEQSKKRMLKRYLLCFYDIPICFVVYVCGDLEQMALSCDQIRNAHSQLYIW